MLCYGTCTSFCRKIRKTDGCDWEEWFNQIKILENTVVGNIKDELNPKEPGEGYYE
jgi:hypothetical protein